MSSSASARSPASPPAVAVVGSPPAPAGPALDPAESALRKRLPPSLPRRDCDVYVTTKTAFPAQLSRCRRLLEGGRHPAVYLHALGAAIPVAANLALRLQKEFDGLVKVDTFTDTVELTDDFERAGGARGESARNNSALHIKIASIATPEDEAKKTGDLGRSPSTS